MKRKQRWSEAFSKKSIVGCKNSIDMDKNSHIVLRWFGYILFTIVEESVNNNSITIILESTYCIFSSMIMILLIFSIGTAYNLGLVPLTWWWSDLLTVAGVCIFLLGAMSVFGIALPALNRLDDWWYNEL